MLAYHFLRKAEAKVNKKVDRFSQERSTCSSAIAWPGNLRELENIIERAVVLATGRQVDVAHLPLHLQESGRPGHHPGRASPQAKERAVARVREGGGRPIPAEARGNVRRRPRGRDHPGNFHSSSKY